MNEREFNEYCVKVMGYKRGWKGKKEVFWLDDEGKRYLYLELYNPYNDLNQMAKVFDKLMSDSNFILMKFMTYDCSHTPPLRIDIPIKQAMRDFIISTMEDKI